MIFFDDKQQVMDIQITPFGVELLSKGEFDPKYFALFDDDILYDGAKAGITEEQNDIETRILSESPRMTAQRRFDDAENLSESLEDPYATAEYISEILPLGRMDSLSDNSKLPLWSIQFYRGEMDSTITEEEGIPQISLDDVEYLIQRHEAEDEPNESKIFDESKYEFDDGTFITIASDYIFIDVEELYSQFSEENFELELFEIESSGKLIPKSFFKEPQLIKYDILLDEPIEYDPDNKTTDSSLADYFFEISVDYEIDEEIACENTVKKDSKGSIYFNNMTGKTCSEDKISISNQYGARKESDLGDTC